MAMDLISQTQRSSSLNPNAPLFVPLAYRTVEDFSDQWWSLVQSSPWFRDYWLQERFQDPEIDSMFSDLDDPVFPDDDDLFDDYIHKEDKAEKKKKSYSKDLISLGALKWGNGRAFSDVPRYIQKAPKIVNVKVSPRTIQQPR